jgi:hypothetical protein
VINTVARILSNVPKALDAAPNALWLDSERVLASVFQ